MAHGALDLNCNLALADGVNRRGGRAIENSRAARCRAQQMLALDSATMEKVEEIIGRELAKRVKEVSLRL